MDGVDGRARIRGFRRYRHSVGRERQLGHGCSPLHFTLRRRQGSQALGTLVRSMSLLAPWALFRLQSRCERAVCGNRRGLWVKSPELLSYVLRDCSAGRNYGLNKWSFEDLRVGGEKFLCDFRVNVSGADPHIVRRGVALSSAFSKNFGRIYGGGFISYSTSTHPADGQRNKMSKEDSTAKFS